jgi:hypothetical protein
VRGFLAETADLLYRADVLAFSHYGAIRALVANLLDLTDAEMMSLDVPNGGAFLFARTFDTAAKPASTRQPLPEHILPKTAAAITQPPAAPPQGQSKQ